MGWSGRRADWLFFSVFGSFSSFFLIADAVLFGGDLFERFSTMWKGIYLDSSTFFVM